MNIELFEEIKAKIRAESNRFLMGDWKSYTDCGTAFCIGGWACALRDEAATRTGWLGSYHHGGAAHLGITDNQARRLFMTSKWPTRFFHRRMEMNEYTPEFAELACEVIDDFIATNGWEYPEYPNAPKQAPVQQEQIQINIPAPRQLA